MGKVIYKFHFILILFLVCQANYAFSKIDLGIDVLVKDNFAEIKGKRIALLTNFSGRDNNDNLTSEILASTKEVKLTLILTPEHGFYGVKSAGETVENSEYRGIPIVSLYGSSKLIPATYSDNFDVIVVDLQDIGVRAYTFISTLYYVMQSASILDKEIIILDRPNPMGGLIVDGNILQEDFKSYIGTIPTTYLHGMTIGELAMMMKEEGWINSSKTLKTDCRLSIIKMNGWKRWMQWEDTELSWYPTSPNIPSVDAIRGAAMIGWIGELSLFSVGIGTNLPFQYFGSPQITNKFFNTFSDFELNGSKLIQTEFMPVYGKCSNQQCKGFLLKFDRTNNYTPYTNGIELLLTLRQLYPQIFNSNSIDYLKKQMFEKATGTSQIFDLLFTGGTDEGIRKASNAGLLEFLTLRKKYLLY